MQTMKLELTREDRTRLRAIATGARTLSQAKQRVVTEFGISEGEATKLLAKIAGPDGAKLYNADMSQPYPGR